MGNAKRIAKRITASLTGVDRCPVCGGDTELAGWGLCDTCGSECAGRKSQAAPGGQ